MQQIQTHLLFPLENVNVKPMYLQKIRDSLVVNDV